MLMPQANPEEVDCHLRTPHGTTPCASVSGSRGQAVETAYCACSFKAEVASTSGEERSRSRGQIWARSMRKSRPASTRPHHTGRPVGSEGPLRRLEHPHHPHAVASVTERRVPRPHAVDEVVASASCSKATRYALIPSCRHMLTGMIYLAASHRSNDDRLSVDFHPRMSPSTPISSSRSGQWTPRPAPLISVLSRSADVPCERRGNHPIGTLIVRPSSKSTDRVSSVTLTWRILARVTSAEVIPFISQSLHVLLGDSLDLP